MTEGTLNKLMTVIESRKKDHPDNSYVSYLLDQGLNKILEKVGEEAIEVILASKDAKITNNNDNVIYETADLLFHILVMLSVHNVHPKDIMSELENRFNISGLEEKKNRQ